MWRVERGITPLTPDPSPWCLAVG